MIAECQNSGYPKKGCVELFAFLTIIIASLGIFAEEALVVPNQPEPKFEYEQFVTLPQEELSLPIVPNSQNASDLSPFPRDLELLIPPPPQAPTRLLEVPLFAAVLGPLQFAGIGDDPIWLGNESSPIGQPSPGMSESGSIPVLAAGQAVQEQPVKQARSLKIKDDEKDDDILKKSTVEKEKTAENEPLNMSGDTYKNYSLEVHETSGQDSSHSFQEIKESGEIKVGKKQTIIDYVLTLFQGWLK